RDDGARRIWGAFGGGLEVGGAGGGAGRGGGRRGGPGAIPNPGGEGGWRPRAARRRLDSRGNRLWHTDASYMPVPVVLGMLYAVVVPPASPLGGGETEFADMRAAYDALPEPMKDEIGGALPRPDIFLSHRHVCFTHLLPAHS